MSNVAIGPACNNRGVYTVVIGRSTVAPDASGCVVFGDNLHASRNFECLIASPPAVGMPGSTIDKYIDFHTRHNNTESRDRCIAALQSVTRL